MLGQILRQLPVFRLLSFVLAGLARTWCFAGLLLSALAAAEDKIELETTVIKGNTELPKILYVVPWQEATEGKLGQQKLTLHSLFGDLFEPVTPEKPPLLDAITDP